MFRKIIKTNLETEIVRMLYTASGDGALSRYIVAQFLTDEVVDKYVEIMLKHVSETELDTLFKVINTSAYQRYMEAVQETFEEVNSDVEGILNLLVKAEGNS